MIKGVFTLDAKQREAKVAKLREWLLTYLAQNRPTAQLQFSLNKVAQPLANFATGCNLSQTVDDMKFLLLRVALRFFTSSLNAPLNWTDFLFFRKRILDARNNIAVQQNGCKVKHF